MENNGTYVIFEYTHSLLLRFKMTPNPPKLIISKNNFFKIVHSKKEETVEEKIEINFSSQEIYADPPSVIYSRGIEQYKNQNSKNITENNNNCCNCFCFGKK